MDAGARFNGAATVRSRIGSVAGQLSIGVPAGLQWGRDRQVADSAMNPTAPDYGTSALQWGRDRQVADSGRGGERRPAVDIGPRFNGAATVRSRIGRRSCASMGQRPSGRN